MATIDTLELPFRCCSCGATHYMTYPEAQDDPDCPTCFINERWEAASTNQPREDPQ